MKISNLTVKNFLSFGNHEESITFEGSGVNQIYGSNGHGKSTIHNALAFGLYGKTIKNLKKKEIPNNINKKDCLVTIEFIKNSKHYKVVRGISPNIFEIYEDNKLLGQSSKIVDYQIILEDDILGYNFEMFKQLIVLSGSHFVPFFRMTSKNRREILEELLALKELGSMEKILRGYISDNKSKLQQTSAVLQEVIGFIKTQNAYLEKAKDNNEQKIAELNLKIEKINESIDSIQSDVDNHRVELTEKKKDIQALQDTISTLETRLSENNSAIVKLKHDISIHENTINKLNDTSVCNTCHQEIEKSFKEKAINTANENISYTNSILSDTTISINDDKTSLEQAEEMMSKFRGIAGFIQQAQNEIQLKQTEINGILIQIKDVHTDINTDNIKDEIKKQGDRYSELQTELNHIQLQQELYLEAKEFLSDDGVRKVIISKYIPFIVSRMNHWLSELELFATVNITETFEEEIKMRGFDVTRFESCSQGEQARLMLATVFTFREILDLRNNEVSNILVLDEIIDNLDVQGKEQLFKSLKFISKEKNMNIFVITHANVNDDVFDKVITVQKQGNFSKIL